MEELLSRYREIRRRCQNACQRAGRSLGDVTLVAVSKTKPFEAIEALYSEGHRDFGENYVQELIEKATLARERGLEGIRWHFIGHLQTNKVKQLLPWVSRIHSVDSEKLLLEIEKRALALQIPRVPALIELNLDQQATKSGVTPEQLTDLVSRSRTLERTEIDGLMAIPDPERPAGSRDAFEKLAHLAQQNGLSKLSMGMTSDFEEAIAAGSHFVRVGTAIFGERT